MSNKVPSNITMTKDYRVSNPNLKKGNVLVYQPKSQLVESVARSNMMIVLMEQIIVLVVIKLGTRLGISLMIGVKIRVVVKLKQVF